MDLKHQQARAAKKRGDLLDLQIQQVAGKLVKVEEIDRLVTAVGVAIRKTFEGLRWEVRQAAGPDMVALVEEYHYQLVSEVSTAIRR